MLAFINISETCGNQWGEYREVGSIIYLFNAWEDNITQCPYVVWTVSFADLISLFESQYDFIYVDLESNFQANTITISKFRFLSSFPENESN